MKKRNKTKIALINDSKKCPKCKREFTLRMNGNVADIYVHSGTSCCVVLEQPR